MDIRKKFGERVRELREGRGWSQEDLAEVSGLHRTYVSGIERGTRNPTLLIIQRLANAFESRPAELLDWEKRK